VPRLSMIVPFQRDELALEETLLSALESRTGDDELIIVHAGDFSDPYQLDGDEAIVLEANPTDSLAEQLNQAVATACSPTVQILLPGTVVQRGWADEALEVFQDRSIEIVSLPIQDANSGDTTFGLKADEIPHRRMARGTEQCGAPILAGTMMRRRTLIKIGGWCESIPSELLDVELAILCNLLDIPCVALDQPRLTATKRTLVHPNTSFEVGKGCGMLACAYGEIPHSGVEVEPLVKRLGHLATGLMNPKLAAERLGWVLGVRDRSWVHRLTARVESARESMSETLQSIPMPSSSRSERRAA